MRECCYFLLYLLMDVYPLFIKQSMTDFNKGIFDPLNNAYIVTCPSKIIRLNNIYFIKYNQLRREQ